MLSFTQRSCQKELLDGDDIPFADIQQNMRELDFINRCLGGHAVTVRGLSMLLGKASSSSALHVMEIGCGGGDNLRAIKRWAMKQEFAIELSGVDINVECIAFAKEQAANEDIDFICADYRNAVIDRKPDVIFSSLFCHHFTNEELVGQLQWMKNNTTAGFFINDLHRHPVAYQFIKTMTAVFSKSRLVKNDAPLSVQRGFVQSDWQQLFAKAGLNGFECRWAWAFRWLIVYRKNASAG